VTTISRIQKYWSKKRQDEKRKNLFQKKIDFSISGNFKQK